MTDTGGGQLTDAAELLLRHIHPSWVRDGAPTSQAFKPSQKDQGKLSTARGSLTTAAAAFALHTGPMRLAAAGTWAVSVAEVGEDPVPLSAFGDPVVEPVPDPAHAYIDFAGQDRKATETKAKLLKAAALRRGRQHPPR